MRTHIRNLLTVIAITAGIATLALANGCSLLGEKNETSPASIQPTGKVAPSDLPSLAKIDFQQAAAAVLAAAPGENILKAELKIDDGGLVYAFKIAPAGKKSREVLIDAGNGKVIPDGDND